MRRSALISLSALVNKQSQQQIFLIDSAFETLSEPSRWSFFI